MSTVQRVLARLKKAGTATNRDGMARYAIPSQMAFGVAMADIQRLAKEVGRDHSLAQDLWKTGWYEARTMCAYIAEPERLTITQMDRWCKDFDNWAICDTLCFALFDRSVDAWGRVDAWARLDGEFQKRAAFALLAGLALHDAKATDAQFRTGLRLIGRASNDSRNFVKKGVSWALRSIGHRNVRLHGESVALARELATSADAASRWVGKDALRDLTRPMVAAKIARRAERQAIAPSSRKRAIASLE